MGFGGRENTETPEDISDRDGTVKVVTWNIAGASKIQEVWDWLKNYDVIALQETWVERKDEKKIMCELDKDFKWTTKPVVRKKRRGRAIGGQLVGIRKSAFKSVSVGEWREGMVIKGIKTGEENVTIITVYNNCGFQKLQNDLETVIREAGEKSDGIIIIGDINARIGEDGGSVRDCEEERGERKSKDKTKNAEGRRLIDFCDDKELLVLNGRCEGDWEGQWTFIGDGQEFGSVIDYIIVSEGKDYWVKEMIVQIRIESDHLPVSVNIEGAKSERRTERNREKEVSAGSREKVLMRKEDLGRIYSESGRVSGDNANSGGREEQMGKTEANN